MDVVIDNPSLIGNHSRVVAPTRNPQLGGNHGQGTVAARVVMRPDGRDEGVLLGSKIEQECGRPRPATRPARNDLLERFARFSGQRAMWRATAWLWSIKRYAPIAERSIP